MPVELPVYPSDQSLDGFKKCGYRLFMAVHAWVWGLSNEPTVGRALVHVAADCGRTVTLLVPLDGLSDNIHWPKAKVIQSVNAWAEEQGCTCKGI